MENKMNKKQQMNNKKRKDLIFYCCLLLLPLTHFCIFYIYINANALLMAFKEHLSVLTGEGGFRFLKISDMFTNFKEVIQTFFGTEAQRDIIVRNVLSNSLKAFGMQLLVALPLGILFAYYDFKKCLFHGVFKVFLFLPSIISSVVMCLIFRYLSTDIYIFIAKSIFNVNVKSGLLYNPATVFPTLLGYQLWVGFGTTVLLFSGAMSAINESVVEAGRIDGATSIREFIHIVFPLTFPTLIVFITLQIANLFTNQLNIYSFFGGVNADSEIYTMGFYMYHETIVARTNSGANYPYLSALGLMITMVIAPITITVNYLLKKYGPSVN